MSDQEYADRLVAAANVYRAACEAYEIARARHISALRGEGDESVAATKRENARDVWRFAERELLELVRGERP